MLFSMGCGGLVAVFTVQDRSLAEQNKHQTLLRELREAQRNRKSEQLSKEQLV